MMEEYFFEIADPSTRDPKNILRPRPAAVFETKGSLSIRTDQNRDQNGK